MSPPCNFVRAEDSDARTTSTAYGTGMNRMINRCTTYVEDSEDSEDLLILLNLSYMRGGVIAAFRHHPAHSSVEALIW